MGEDPKEATAKDRKINIIKLKDKDDEGKSTVKAGVIKKRVTREAIQFFAFSGFPETANTNDLVRFYWRIHL